MSDHRCRLRAHPYASHYFKSPVHRTRNKCMLGSDGKFDISGVGLYYATIVKSCATVVRRPILSHALSRLRRRNKHRFEGDPLANALFFRTVIILRCQSHTRMVVRECFKGEEASQWKRQKFDPSPHQNPLTDLHKNWQA